MITIKNIRRARQRRGLAALSIPVGLLALGLGGCKSLGLGGPEAQSVQSLAAKDLNGTLYISWTNPVDYKRLSVVVTDAQKVSRALRPSAWGRGRRRPSWRTRPRKIHGGHLLVHRR